MQCFLHFICYRRCIDSYIHYFMEMYLLSHVRVSTHLLCSPGCHTQTQLSDSDPPVSHRTNGPHPASHQSHAKKASWWAHCNN